MAGPALQSPSVRLFAIVALALSLATGVSAQDRPDWVEIDYSDVQDARKLAHSGEPVGQLLTRLGGRPLPPPGQRGDDKLRHSLLDPLAEPYAFVLPDLLDSIEPPPDPPLIEIAQLWDSGEVQPAWVELLRARRYVVESDGSGRMRLFLPARNVPATSAEAAEQAYRQAWPVLRHVFAAERRRLTGGRTETPTLTVRAYAYQHARELSRFRLGLSPHQTTVDDTRPDGARVPLDLAGLQAFLDSGLQLEGGRLNAQGTIDFLGSRVERRPQMLGEPIDLSDFAVAYRAVFHGGLAEPYMSLERSLSPWMTVVNYGGRLRDTRLGMVSLLCDIRFKTFSVGLGIAENRDMREEVRALVPEFQSHVERFALHPQASAMLGQQTRLWFYPDSVDLTVSAQGDLLAMRSVRMSATSERVLDLALNPAQGEDPPWTQATVAAINNHYDALTTFFPEMADLDQVVRLLSFFTWLRGAQERGLPVPELDSLLAVELPSAPTPRLYPRLLAFTALPEPGSQGVIDAFDRVPVGDALERLHATEGRVLSAERRMRRALAALDPDDPEHARFLEVAGKESSRANEMAMDLTAYQAERLYLHQRVLSSLEPEQRTSLLARQNAGESLRVFSVGIGGLDLGMEPVLTRASSTSMGLTGGILGVATPVQNQASGASAPARRVASEPRAEWRRDPNGLPATPAPAHGIASHELRGEFPGGWVERLVDGDGNPKEVWTVYGADGPEVATRKLTLGSDGRATLFERVEDGRAISYRFEGGGESWRVVSVPAVAPAIPVTETAATLPEGLAMLRIAFEDSSAAETAAVGLRLDASPGGTPRALQAASPRSLLRRLVLGRLVDSTPGAPLSGFSPLPGALGDVRTMMVLQESWQAAPPWDGAAPPLAGEEDPAQVARSLLDWWAATGTTESPAAVVGTSLARSPERWSAAPKAGTKALLLLPEDAFPGESAALRTELAERWNAGEVVSSLPDQIGQSVVILVSHEAPGMFARRLREIATAPSLRGKLLAAWTLAGPVRPDLPASLLGTSELAGLGIAEWSVTGRRNALGTLAGLSGALSSAPPQFRVEQLPGPFLWYF